MGYTSYSTSDRSLRATSLGYDTKPINEIFVQNNKKQIYDLMNPKSALLRESRDSDVHPNTVPIIVTLDVTGSMGNIPHHLVKSGLPNFVSALIQKGIQDPQILFLAVGDHECDRYPLQVGQFESGDAELDLWLTRTYIEGGGGGNAGESYLLSWYYAANHTSIDSFEKRKKKGILFTIGDEPSLTKLPANVITEIFGTPTQESFTDKQLLEMVSEKYEVFHLHVMEGYAGKRSVDYWQRLMGQRCVIVNNHKEIDKIMSDVILSNIDKVIDNFNVISGDDEFKTEGEPMIL